MSKRERLSITALSSFVHSMRLRAVSLGGMMTLLRWAVAAHALSLSLPAFAQGDAELDSLAAGYELMASGDARGAIDRHFDPIIENYAATHEGSGKKIFGSRSPVETLMYMFMATADKVDAMAIGPNWGQALFLKAFALIELGDLESATKVIEEAIALSPSNSQYLSERGYIHQLTQEWESALEVFERSEEAADAYSPENIRIVELTRAKRGAAYALVELGRLDEAEAKYLECLDLDKADESAARELDYVQELKQRLNAPR